MRRIESGGHSRFTRAVVADRKVGVLTQFEADRLLNLCEHPHGDAYLWEQRRKIIGRRRRDLFVRYAAVATLLALLVAGPSIVRWIGKGL